MMIKLCGGVDGMGGDSRLRKVRREPSGNIGSGQTPYNKRIHLLVSGKRLRELVFSPSSAPSKLCELGQLTFLSGYFLIFKNKMTR